MEDKDKKVSIPDPTMGPFGFTISSIKKALNGLKALIKNPKILILTLFISGLQTGLAYLKIYLPTSELVKYASLITFAQGGCTEKLWEKRWFHLDYDDGQSLDSAIGLKTHHQHNFLR